MTTSQTCHKCGSRLGRSALSGLCARCMLEAGLLEPTDRLTDETSEPSPPELADGGVAPGRFGHYELLEEIGRGGMGIVYRARDLTINRVVALKLIVTGQFASKREVERFRAEAGAAARLDHPNIVPVYEVGEENGRPFFSMKFMEGGTLTRRLAASSTPQDSRHAASLVVKISRAIHHAHQRAILHRDIKPGNVLLDSQGEPHVSDLGLAKFLDRTESVTLSGATLGSPSYMSPEQAAGQTERLTTATDTYSLGALLYQLLTGQPPFEAATPMATMEKVLHREPIAPRAIRPGTDPDLETICLKCLEKDPQRRYASADALAEDLERWLRGEPIQARPCSLGMRLWKWTRRQPRVALLALISMLAIVAFVGGQTIMSLRLSRANTEVRATNTRLSASLYELRWRKADEASRAGERDEAIAWLSYFVRRNPSDTAATARLLSLLSSYNFPLLLHPPLRHETPLIGIDFNRTGDRLASVSSAGIIRVLEVRSGKVEIELADPAEARITSFTLGGSNDLRLLTVSSEPKARLWDLNSRRIVKEISLGALDAALSWRTVLPTRDRRLLAINVESNAVAVLDAESGAWVAAPVRLPTGLRNFALSEDGRRLATGAGSEVRLWDVTNQQALFAPVLLPELPATLHFSEDGRWLVWLAGGKIEVINTGTGEREREFDVRNSTGITFVGAESLIMTQDGAPKVFNFRTGQDCGSAFGAAQFDWLGQPALAAHLFSDKGLDRLVLLDPAIGRPGTEPFFHDGWINQRRVHPSGVVATASQDRELRIWSVEMGRTEPITVQAGDAVWEGQWSPSGEKILSAAQREGRYEARLWDGKTGVPVTPARDTVGVVYFAAWAPDGSRFATALGDRTARIWSGETGEAISPALRHDGPVFDCIFSPDGAVLATGDGRAVHFWDGRTGKGIGAPLLHPGVLKTRFSADGKRVATASNDGTIRVWSVPDGAMVLGPLRHDGTCWVAAFSPDDRLLVSASADGTVRLWDATTGKPALPPFRHEGPVLWASFSPDGRAIASSTESGIVRVWATDTGQPLSEPMRHPGRVWTVKWSPDGKLLATICTDGEARIWSPFTGHLAAEPFAHQKGKEIRRVGFSPDGRRFLTASAGGTLKIWELSYLHPPVPAPEWLPDLAEALGGKRIGAKDVPETVPGESFQSVKHRIAGAREQDDYYARWAKWMLEERLQRPVKPFRP